MKFLVDAQLPRALSHFLNSKGLNSLHTLDLPNQNKTKDTDLVSFAVEEKRIVITKDSDFLDSFLLSGKPSKLLLVKTGNIPNSALLNIFDQHLSTILDLLEQNALLELTRTEIVVHR